MIEALAVGSGLLALLGLGIGVIIWSVLAQEKGLSKQQEALNHIDESLALQRRGVQLAEQTLANDQEMVRLLRELVASRTQP